MSARARLTPWLVLGLVAAAAAGWLMRLPNPPVAGPAPPQDRGQPSLALPVHAAPALRALPVPERPRSVALALFGRNGRLIDLGGQGVARYLEPRMAAVRRGEIRPAYEVYQALSLCAALDDAEGTERQQIAEACRGVSPLQVQERLRWLTQAAQAGVVDAQVDFYFDGRRSQNPALPADDPGLQAWKAEALDHLQRAARHCDHFAMGLLATLSESGELAPADPAQALRYAVANAQVRGLPISTAALRDRFGEEVADADLAAAIPAGLALAAEACARPR